MYGTTYYSYSKSASDLSTNHVYGGDVTYSNGTYTLIDTLTFPGMWQSNYTLLNNYHYTCFSTGTTCSSVYYIYFTIQNNGAYYISLTNGKKVEDALNEMLTNKSDSTAKGAIDSWYNTNLSSYTSYIEDTVYCNDRSISQLNGWDPDGGGSLSRSLYFGSRARTYTNYVPSFICSRIEDRFTVSDSIGNGKLTYPVGLITSDEIMYAGGKGNTNNNTYYLFTNQDYMSGSPLEYDSYASHEIIVSSTNGISTDYVTNTNGIRPVISLKATDIVESGDGTSTNPYVIKTN
jgi:hypothetical protein